MVKVMTPNKAFQMTESCYLLLWLWGLCTGKKRFFPSLCWRRPPAICTAQSNPWLLPGPCITCLPTALSSATPPPPISSHRSARRTVTFAKSGFLIAGIVCAERSARQHMARNSRNYSSAFSVVVVGSDLGGHPSTVQTTRAWLQKPLSCLQQWQASRLYLESLGECCSPASY